MTNHTTLTQCLVFVHKRAALRRVTLKAGFVSTQETKPAGLESLLNIGATAFDRDALMRVMAIGAAHSAFEHRMVVRQLERCSYFQVALETSLRIFPRIDDGVRRATALDVQTARPVAGLAAHVLGVLSFGHQTRMRSCFEVAHDLFVAGLTFLGADKLCARNARWRENCSASRAAGKQNDGQRGCSPGAPKQFLALTVDRSS